MTLSEYQEIHPKASGVPWDLYERRSRREWIEQECREFSIHEFRTVHEINDAIHELAAMIQELLSI
jgi:hypothetical protein